MSIERPIERAALADYSLSLQLAAEALWGDDFWDGRPPRTAAPEPVRRKRRRSKRGSG